MRIFVYVYLKKEATQQLLEKFLFYPTQFLNASSLVQDDESCSSRLQKFLILNGTTEQKREITSKFCSLNKTEVASFFDFMIPNLEIGDLVQIVSNHSRQLPIICFPSSFVAQNARNVHVQSCL